MTDAFRPGARREEILSLEGVSLWLSGREILHDVGFSLQAGEVTGLIGSNGAGKTTIFRVILGLETPSAGKVLFAGHQINSDYLGDLLALMDGKNVAVNVISKSGTTTEPGVTFRVVRQWMEKKYGRAGAAKRIIATTDPAKGALRKLAREEGYATFDIPEKEVAVDGIAGRGVGGNGAA